MQLISGLQSTPITGTIHTATLSGAMLSPLVLPSSGTPPTNTSGSYALAATSGFQSYLHPLTSPLLGSQVTRSVLVRGGDARRAEFHSLMFLQSVDPNHASTMIPPPPQCNTDHPHQTLKPPASTDDNAIASYYLV